MKRKPPKQKPTVYRVEVVITRIDYGPAGMPIYAVGYPGRKVSEHTTKREAEAATRKLVAQ